MPTTTQKNTLPEERPAVQGLKQIFSRRTDSVSYKAIYEEDVELTPEEIEIALRKTRTEKAAITNQANYLKSISNEITYVIPNAAQLKTALIEELKTIYGWTIDQYNLPAIDILCSYFSMDGKFESIDEGYSLKKGLFLYGPVGCGKTTLMHVMGKNSFNPYVVISCREVANQYAQSDIGHKAIDTYSSVRRVNKSEYLGNEILGYCFDDLGTEPNKKNFGNELNVMAEILLNRYDSKVGIGKTHTTTNLSADNIKSEYGPRVSSRMREMFNIIEFDTNSPDRRK